jgi:RNA polymerase sigma factor (sigma-70 family)
MANHTLNTVLRHLHEFAASPGSGELTDRQLLARFAAQRDEAAFAALIRRHGPLVLGVCGRMLPRPEDAEDAFQATFLVLARKAGSGFWQESVGNWLYGVAWRLSRKARAAEVRRQARERQAAQRPATESPPEVVRRELRSVLDEELQTLPERYRAPLLLCYLQGETRDEAARHLGWSLGTFKRRLERGRDLLRRRLIRRGWDLAVALPAAVLASSATSVVRAASIARAAAAFADHAAVGPSFAAKAAALAEATLRGCLTARLKAAAVLALTVAVLASGAGLVVRHVRTVQASEPGPEKAARLEGTAAASPTPVAAAPARSDLFGDPLPPSALVRMGTVRSRHGGGVAALAFAPDQKTLASGGQDNAVRVWDIVTGKEIHQFEPARGPSASFAWVELVALSPDGQRLAAGCGNGETAIVVWDLATGKEVLRRPGQGSIMGLAFLPDGKGLVSGASNGSISLWDLTTGKVRQPFEGHPGGLRCLALSADGRLLASGGDDNAVCLWDVATGKKLQTLRGNGGMVVSLAYSPDGNTLASGYWDRILRLWEVGTGKPLRECKGHFSAVSALAFFADGQTLASGSWDGSVRLWEVNSGKEVRQFMGHYGPVPAVAVSRDGNTVASGGWDATVRLWSVATGRELRPSSGHQHAIMSVAVSPDGRTLATAGQTMSSASGDGQVRLWDLATGKELRQLRAPVPSALGSLVFTPDGKTLFSGQSTIHTWNVATGKPLSRFRPDQGGIPLVLSPDGNILAAGGFDGTITLLDPASGKKLRQVKPHKDAVRAITFSPDGKLLASGSQDRTGTIVLWDAATGKEVRRLEAVNNFIMSLAFAPDGQMLASAGFNTRNYTDSPVQFWNVATGKEVRRLKTAGMSVIVLAPDGKTLATASGDHAVVLWEVATGQERRRFVGHQGTVWSIAFTPDGRRLTSGSSDTTALVWDVAGLLGDQRSLATAPTAGDLEALWADLAGDDAGRAHRAIWRMALAPRQAVPFLEGHLRPQTQADAGQVERLLADLNSPSFAVRKKATAALESLGEATGPALRAALRDQRSLEVRQRLEQLVDRFEPQKSPARFRELRAVEVLEQAGTSQARQVLKSLAGGVPEARLTREARASLERLGKRTPAAP